MQHGNPDRSDEITLLATFTLPEHARAAQSDLRAAGFDVVQIADAGGGPDGLGQPLVEWGRYGYQPRLMDDKWTTAASWDNALGLNFGEGTLLTAVVPAAERAQAARLIEKAGGTL